jgi:entericidin B
LLRLRWVHCKTIGIERCQAHLPGALSIAGGGPPHSANLFARKSIMARKLLAVLMMLGMLGPLSALSGCNTVAGAGKDIERGGEKVQDTARDVQRKM